MAGLLGSELASMLNEPPPRAGSGVTPAPPSGRAASARTRGGQERLNTEARDQRAMAQRQHGGGRRKRDGRLASAGTHWIGDRERQLDVGTPGDS